MDRSFVELNRASRERMRSLANRLTDDEMLTKVGGRWTVAIVYAHIAWWDRRVMYVLDMTGKDGKLFVPEMDILVNDLSLPLWAAVPPRDAALIAMENAEALNKRLEDYPGRFWRKSTTTTNAGSSAPCIATSAWTRQTRR